MPTEVWFRNPTHYVQELAETGEFKVAWDHGLLVKRKIDPIKHAELYFGMNTPWRILTVGKQGSAEYRPGDSLDSPTAVYPTWGYGEDADILEDFMAFPIGQDEEACSDTSIPKKERPVLGQEHRVIITDLPSTTLTVTKSFLRYLKSLMEDFPDCIIHLHGLYGYKTAFAHDWPAVDLEPRSAAAKGKVHLPNGKEVRHETTVSNPHWVRTLGFKPVDLEVPRNRCMFNIKSAVWAGQFYTQEFKFRSTRTKEVADYKSSDEDFTPVETAARMTSPQKAAEGDYMLCDTCSLQNKCKFFRTGAVCTVPGAESVRLAKMFNTRNADDIIDGLGTLLAANTNRLERGLHYEQVDQDLSPEVSKMMGQVFDQGVKLAKLIDPGRFSGGAKVQVNVGNGGHATAIAGANPRQIAASVVQSLVEQGIPRDKITPAMIQGVLEGMVNPDGQQKAIEGMVVSEKLEK